MAFERVTTLRAKFGFPYVVCVRRHTRDSILRDFERRLPNDAKAEVQTSIGKSAGSRRCVSINSSRRGQASGARRLSTHVLDTHSGRPAAGIAWN